jgi:hypothetical protein
MYHHTFFDHSLSAMLWPVGLATGEQNIALVMPAKKHVKRVLYL